MVHFFIKKFYTEKSFFVYNHNFFINNYNYVVANNHKKTLFFFIFFFLKKNIFFPRQNKIFNIKNNCIPVKECLYHQKTFVNLIKSIVYKFTTKKHMVWLYFNKKKDKFHRYSIFLYFLNTKIKLFNFLRKVEMKAFLVHGINRTT